MADPTSWPNKEQNEKMVGDSKKPYTNPNKTNNRGQVIMIAENIKNAVHEEKNSKGTNYNKKDLVSKYIMKHRWNQGN